MEDYKKWFTYKDTGLPPTPEQNYLMLSYVKTIRKCLKQKDDYYRDIENCTFLKDIELIKKRLSKIEDCEIKIKECENKLKYEFDFPGYALLGI